MRGAGLVAHLPVRGQFVPPGAGGRLRETGGQRTRIADGLDPVRPGQGPEVNGDRVAGAADRGQAGQPVAVDRDGLRPGLPQPVGQDLQVDVEHPVPGVGAAGRSVVDLDQHPGSGHRDGAHDRAQAVDLASEDHGLVVVAESDRPEPVDLGRQLIRPDPQPVLGLLAGLDPVDQLGPFGLQRRGGPGGLQGGDREHHSDQDRHQGQRAAASRPGLTPSGHQRIVGIEGLADDLVEQVHAGVRPPGRRLTTRHLATVVADHRPSRMVAAPPRVRPAGTCGRPGADAAPVPWPPRRCAAGG